MRYNKLNTKRVYTSILMYIHMYTHTYIHTLILNWSRTEMRKLQFHVEKRHHLRICLYLHIYMHTHIHRYCIYKLKSESFISNKNIHINISTDIYIFFFHAPTTFDALSSCVSLIVIVLCFFFSLSLCLRCHICKIDCMCACVFACAAYGPKISIAKFIELKTHRKYARIHTQYTRHAH